MHTDLPSTDFLKINGVSSSTVGIYVDTPPVPPMAHKRYKNYFYDVDDDYVYDDIQFTVRFFTFYNEDFDNTAIYDFFHDAETLEISRLSGYYYKIKDFSIQQPEVTYDGARIEYRIDFTLAPFRYKTANPEIEIDVQPNEEFTVTSSGTQFCKPTFCMTVSGVDSDITAEQTNISIWVNDVHFGVSNVGSGEIVIDSETMTILKDNDTNLLTHSYGDFLYMHTGDNVIKYAVTNGTVTELTVKLNERSF